VLGRLTERCVVIGGSTDWCVVMSRFTKWLVVINTTVFSINTALLKVAFYNYLLLP
jgi:hypothetical protein